MIHQKVYPSREKLLIAIVLGTLIDPPDGRLNSHSGSWAVEVSLWILMGASCCQYCWMYRICLLLWLCAYSFLDERSHCLVPITS